MNGKESEQRKNALYRGLFLEATPLEGKYIARTALRNMLAGVGHKTMLAALFQAFHCDQDQGLKGLQSHARPRKNRGHGPHLRAGGINRPAQDSHQSHDNSQRQSNESRIRRRDAGSYAFLPKYPGLRVQVHKTKGEALIFTSRLRNITTALNGLSQQLGAIEEDFIVDADLIGFQEGKICRQAEMVRYINRRRLSRRSRLQPALLAYDLIYLSGEDACSRPYLERRKSLLATLGEPKPLPFPGISTAEENLPGNDEAVHDYLARVRKRGGEGLWPEISRRPTPQALAPARIS